LLHLITKFIAKILCRLIFRTEIKGTANVRNFTGGAILAVNHTSLLDPILASSSYPGPVYFLARKTLFRNKLFGAYIKALHAVPFNRDAADIKTLREIIKILKEGKIVIIFPEGTRSITGELQKPRLGIGLIALRASVPVIPMYIDGAYKALPKGKKFLKISKIKVSIGKPIILDKWFGKERIEKEDYKKVADLIMKNLKKLKENIYTV